MIRLFINGLSASAGGGLTYLRNVIPHLARRADAEVTALLNPVLGAESRKFTNIRVIGMKNSSVWWRFLREQATLPGLIRDSGAQALISTGNFALWNSPVPQILLSRNSLYTSADFLRDVRARRDYSIWIDTRIKGWCARQSIRRAVVTVAPSEAFSEELRRWSGEKIATLHHGFDRDAFISGTEPPAVALQSRLEPRPDELRLLFVSHYNYYRNFETLFRALPILRGRLKGKKVKLFLTCRLSSDENPGSYKAEAASALVRALRAGDSVVELGAIPYPSLHHVYRACCIYVTPAYAESFAHPLVEAMASGLPVVASDIPVHREICGDAAVYFPRFSPEALTERILQVHESPRLAERLSQNGLGRSHDFSWEAHVERLLALAEELLHSRGSETDVR